MSRHATKITSKEPALLLVCLAASSVQMTLYSSCSPYSQDPKETAFFAAYHI